MRPLIVPFSVTIGPGRLEGRSLAGLRWIKAVCFNYRGVLQLPGVGSGPETGPVGPEYGPASPEWGPSLVGPALPAEAAMMLVFSPIRMKSATISMDTRIRTR